MPAAVPSSHCFGVNVVYENTLSSQSTKRQSACMATSEYDARRVLGEIESPVPGRCSVGERDAMGGYSAG